ncbi:uncharacterized protein LOC144879100 [Branchiostoma floridae x Branchiostoma japonicum]
MPTSCCALNCTNRKDKGSRKKFFRIPAEPGRRAAWLRALKRSDFEQGKKNPTAAWTPRGHERVCSDHFISGNPSKDPADPDYVPSLFNLPTSASCNRSRNPVAKKDRYMRAAKRLRVSSENEAPPTSLNDEEMIADPPPESVETLRDPLPESVETLREQLTKVQEEKCKLEQFCESLQSEADNLREERDHLQEQIKKSSTSASNLTDAKCKLFTGIPTVALFMFVFRLVSDFIAPLKSMCQQDQILMTLMKLRLGLKNADLALRFSVSASTVSKVINRCIPILAVRLKFLIHWPSKETVKRNLPKKFRKKKYSNCRVIIDCSEIFTERPYNLKTRAKTWSNYKHHHTFKFLVGITPYGAVSFLSSSWGGRISDKDITLKSRFYNKVEYGDMIMADRGFTISEELALKGATLVMPPFTTGRTQLPGRIVQDARQISTLRIHVERAIERIKNFQILSQICPLTFAPLLSDSVVICAALTNLLPKLIK